VVGAELGVEIWEATRWQTELDLLSQHELQEAEADMAAELAAAKLNQAFDTAEPPNFAA